MNGSWTKNSLSCIPVLSGAWAKSGTASNHTGHIFRMLCPVLKTATVLRTGHNMRNMWPVWLLAVPLFAQAPLRTGMQLSEFFVHDPFILAYKPTQTYYLYNAAGARQLGGQRGGVVAYKS